MDELKKYIQNNKSQLEEDVPSPIVWNRIQQGIKPVEQTIPVVKMIRWAVAACVIGLAGVGGWYLLNQKPTITTEKTIAVVSPKIKVADSLVLVKTEPAIPKTHKYANSTIRKSIKPQIHEFEIIQANFTQVINLQKARISTMPMYAENAAYFKDFNLEIKRMDKEEKNITTTIAKQGMNDELLDQLINLYQQKLTILKQLQLEMNKTNNRFKQNRGPVDTTRTYFLSI